MAMSVPNNQTTATMNHTTRKLMYAMVFALPASVYAIGTSKDPNDAFASPTVLFDASTKIRDTVKVTWRVVDDPQAVCEEYAQKKFDYQIDSCAARTDDSRECTIVTGRQTTMADLGHELRHCFQGSWHSKDLGKDPRSISR